MNKYQKLIAKISKYSMAIDMDYGILDTSFSFSRRCWREELQDCKNNYAAIKARKDFLKTWQ